MSRPPSTGRKGQRLVRLSQVPLDTRLKVAYRLVRVEGLVGVPALELLMAATEPRHDPWLLVPEEIARKVIGRVSRSA